jgi:hypothetical protein
MPLGNHPTSGAFYATYFLLHLKLVSVAVAPLPLIRYDHQTSPYGSRSTARLSRNSRMESSVAVGGLGATELQNERLFSISLMINANSGVQCTNRRNTPGSQAPQSDSHHLPQRGTA